MISFPPPSREHPAAAPSDPAEAHADPAEKDAVPAGGRPVPAAESGPFLGGLTGVARVGLAGATYGRLGACAGLTAVAFGVGAVLRAAGGLPVDALPPLHAHTWLLIIPLLPATALALAGVTVLPAAVRRLLWAPLLGISWLAAATWAVALQLPDGLSRPLTTSADYLAGLPAMGNDPLGWLRGFTTHIREYPIHVKGHPPLPMLILWILRWTGLEGAGWAAALVVAAGASSTAAIAITVRAVASEPTARRALPFLILAPTAIWVATSMDALFLGVSSWGMALLARAASRKGRGGPRPPWGVIPLLSSRAVDLGDKRFHRLWITFSRAWSAAPGTASASATLGDPAVPTLSTPTSTLRAVGGAFVGGVLVGSLPYLSYGLVSLLALPLAVLIITRPPRYLVLAFGLGCLVVPIASAFAGFLWWDGVIQTHAAWAAGSGAQRPYAYFLIGDLAVDISGVTRGEVERIWLPYAAWMTAGAAIYRAPARRMLLAQAVTALLIQALVKSSW